MAERVTQIILHDIQRFSNAKDLNEILMAPNAGRLGKN